MLKKLLLLTCCLTAICSGCGKTKATQRELADRTENVRLIYAEYLKNGGNSSNASASNILRSLAAKGARLHPVEAKRPDCACYSVLAAPDAAGDPSAVIVQETDNVIGKGYIVRAYGDGSIKVERR